MDPVGRGFPPGDMRVSDADRDRAVAELNEAYRVGRITADEFDERAGQAVRARTGSELTSLLADLPPPDYPADGDAAPAAEPASHYVTVRVVMGAAAFCALLLFAKAITTAAAVGWTGLAPAAIAAVLVGLVVFLHAIRADR